MAQDGLQYIIDHFDGIYKGRNNPTKTSSPITDSAEGQVVGAAGKAQQVTTWLDGNRDMQSIQAALCRLDTDRDLLGATAGGTKSYFEEAEDPAAFYEDDSWEYAEGDELAEYYADSSLDVGYDCSDEEMIWIFGSDLNAEYAEEDIERQFSTFQSVLRAKQQAKKARGWFTPTRWADEHSEKGKGLRVLPKGKGGTKGKGKGKKGESKGKGFGKQSYPYDRMRQERDVRRAQSGMLRVPTSQLTLRICCWRCGNLGHTSRNCGKGISKGSSGGGGGAPAPQAKGDAPRPSYFVLPFDGKATHTGFNFA
eukprot:3058959-Amphidinium_carterae.1